MNHFLQNISTVANTNVHTNLWDSEKEVMFSPLVLHRDALYSGCVAEDSGYKVVEEHWEKKLHILLDTIQEIYLHDTSTNLSLLYNSQMSCIIDVLPSNTIPVYRDK